MLVRPTLVLFFSVGLLALALLWPLVPLEGNSPLRRVLEGVCCALRLSGCFLIPSSPKEALSRDDTETDGPDSAVFLTRGFLKPMFVLLAGWVVEVFLGNWFDGAARLHE